MAEPEMPPPVQWFTYEPGDLVPTQTFRIQHSPEGAGWTNLHRDGSTSYHRIESAGPLWWRVHLTRTSPGPDIEDVSTYDLVFGTRARAGRKADKLLREWDAMHEQIRRDMAEGFEAGLRMTRDDV